MAGTAAPIEAGIGQVWIGKQAALGTAKPTSDTNYIVPRWFGGDLSSNKTNGSEEYVDGLRWGSPAVFTDEAGGAVGQCEYQAQVETTGQAWAWLLGSDTITGAGDPWTHTIDTNGSAVCYITARKKVGANVGPVREVYSDGRVGKIAWACSQQQNVAHVVADLFSLNPAVFALTDPGQAAAGLDPINWSSAVSGTLKINGVAFPEISGESIEADLGITPFYGDNVLPAALVEGKNSPQRTLTTILTALTLPQVYSAIYGTQTPTGGTVVSSTPTFASMDTTYTVSASRSVQYVSPRVELNPDSFKITAKPEAGTVDITFGGNCLKSGATAALTVIVRNGDNASYIV